jgi:F0F1-type ATP synthase alpha subunit
MQGDYDPTERIRILESKYTYLRDRVVLINENLISEYKELSQEIKVVDSELKDLKKDIFEMKEALRHILTEMKYFARKEHFQVLEKYINMWNPFNFVTEEEVLRLIKENRGVKNRKSKKSKEE